MNTSHKAGNIQWQHFLKGKTKKHHSTLRNEKRLGIPPFNALKSYKNLSPKLWVKMVEAGMKKSLFSFLRIYHYQAGMARFCMCAQPQAVTLIDKPLMEYQLKILLLCTFD